MAEARPAWLPVGTLRAQMQALATLGLDLPRVEAAVGPLPESPDALVPQQAYLTMWREAIALYRDDALPTALAMAIPFGAFGALDYLVGSAATLGGCIESARLHFAMVTSDAWLDIHAVPGEAQVVQVRALPDVPALALEFTLACLVHRLRHLGGEGFELLRAGLPAARRPSDPVRQRCYGAALQYGYPCAEIAVSERVWRRECVTADPFLHATMQQLARQLQLRAPADTALESALRMRLRGALAQGRADAGRMARLLGVSERTLQRRLTEIDRSFTQIVEDFRREESARLLCDRSLHLVEVASRLGYAEQTSFTRAFKRWHGAAPGSWRAAHA